MPKSKCSSSTATEPKSKSKSKSSLRADSGHRINCNHPASRNAVSTYGISAPPGTREGTHNPPPPQPRPRPTPPSSPRARGRSRFSADAPTSSSAAQNSRPSNRPPPDDLEGEGGGAVPTRCSEPQLLLAIDEIGTHAALRVVVEKKSARDVLYILRSVKAAREEERRRRALLIARPSLHHMHRRFRSSACAGGQARLPQTTGTRLRRLHSPPLNPARRAGPHVSAPRPVSTSSLGMSLAPTHSARRFIRAAASRPGPLKVERKEVRIIPIGIRGAKSKGTGAAARAVEEEQGGRRRRTGGDACSRDDGRGTCEAGERGLWRYLGPRRDDLGCTRGMRWCCRYGRAMGHVRNQCARELGAGRTRVSTGSGAGFAIEGRRACDRHSVRAFEAESVRMRKTGRAFASASHTRLAPGAVQRSSLRVGGKRGLEEDTGEERRVRSLRTNPNERKERDHWLQTDALSARKIMWLCCVLPAAINYLSPAAIGLARGIGFKNN
ncbi:hypothetical protein DFH09DRAFT_1464214 [Mycena vulgaris]|nr:hypothetical protein DFH09DRAFT_1464214 [Mycena vulgaris]